MGAAIASALEDPDVVEVLLNPDGTLWVDRLSSGRAPTGLKLSREDGDRIIRLVAAHVRVEVNKDCPIVSAELPESGERFEGLIPPVVPAPTFAIRKRASLVYTLDRYVADRILTPAQGAYLAQAVRERLNIVIAGGTSTGKTTLANALLDEVARNRRPRADPGGHARAPVPRRRPGGAPHQARCRVDVRARPLDPAPAPRPHRRRRGPRRGSARTSSRPGAPAIPAGSPPSTPARPRVHSTASSS